MNSRLLNCRILASVVIASSLLSQMPTAVASEDAKDKNAMIVRAAFDAWRNKTGSVFDLLDPNVEWQVAGSSPVSGLYRTREAFLRDAVQPINAKLAGPIAPTVKHVLADKDSVMVLWDGSATTVGGKPYENSYAWHMVLRDGKVIRVTAFLDTWALDELMR